MRTDKMLRSEPQLLSRRCRSGLARDPAHIAAARYRGQARSYGAVKGAPQTLSNCAPSLALVVERCLIPEGVT